MSAGASRGPTPTRSRTRRRPTAPAGTLARSRPSGSFTATFPTAGSFTYHCSIPPGDGGHGDGAVSGTGTVRFRAEARPRVRNEPRSAGRGHLDDGRDGAP